MGLDPRSPAVTVRTHSNLCLCPNADYDKYVTVHRTRHPITTHLQPTHHVVPPLLLWWPIISVVLFVCRRFVRPRSVDENPKINKSCIISLVELGSGGADGTMDVTGFLAPFRRPLMTRTQSLK